MHIIRSIFLIAVVTSAWGQTVTYPAPAPPVEYVAPTAAQATPAGLAQPEAAQVVVTQASGLAQPEAVQVAVAQAAGLAQPEAVQVAVAQASGLAQPEAVQAVVTQASGLAQPEAVQVVVTQAAGLAQPEAAQAATAQAATAAQALATQVATAGHPIGYQFITATQPVTTQLTPAWQPWTWNTQFPTAAETLTSQGDTPSPDAVVGLLQNYFHKGFPGFPHPLSAVSGRAVADDVSVKAPITKCTSYTVTCNAEGLHKSPLRQLHIAARLSEFVVSDLVSPGFSRLTQNLGCWCQPGQNSAIPTEQWLTCPGYINAPFLELYYLQDVFPIAGCQCLPQC